MRRKKLLFPFLGEEAGSRDRRPGHRADLPTDQLAQAEQLRHSCHDSHVLPGQLSGRWPRRCRRRSAQALGGGRAVEAAQRQRGRPGQQLLNSIKVRRTF